MIIENGVKIYEMPQDDYLRKDYFLVGGPFDGQIRRHFPDEIEGEGLGFAEPHPFEAAKWQADPNRMTLLAIYRWDTKANVLQYSGDEEFKITGFCNLDMTKMEIDILKPL